MVVDYGGEVEFEQPSIEDCTEHTYLRITVIPSLTLSTHVSERMNPAEWG